MGYSLTYGDWNAVFRKLMPEYRIYAPKRFEKQGRYSDTDIIRYDEIENAEEIVYEQKSDFSAKEILTPITQTILYFTEDEYRASKTDEKKILIFLRPCDINAFERQDRIYLGNGPDADYYYKRMRDKVRFVMMECLTGWDTCFCVSMGANRTDDYSAAVRFAGDGVLIDVKDEELKPYFEEFGKAEFRPEYIEENECKVTIPDIPDKDTLNLLKKHPVWQEYNNRCISCGACTIACSTCTCFTTVDKVYAENANNGERRRVSASCQIEGFDAMAGGHEFRKTPADRIRYRVLHKIHDYKARFKDYHMCVGCGRCSARCPKYINFPAIIEKMNLALKEMETQKQEGRE